MPMTPDGPARCRSPGAYVTVLTCLGRPRCLRNQKERDQAQRADDCDMCRREYRWVENSE